MDLISFDMMESGYPLLEAVFNENVGEAKNLLETESYDINDADSSGRTALHVAACRGNENVVRMLIEHGADISARDKNDNTPLHWCGHSECISILSKYGADFAFRNKIGATAKDMAKRRGISPEVIATFERYEQLFAKQGFNRNKMTGEDSFMPLWYEFSEELGPRKVFLLILFLLCFSLYIAYTVTGFSKHLEIRLPLEYESAHYEL
ncbi:hypothetical protein CHS0354_001754 [Potamilus streckersoni]|uniref:Uncharacterized protein n=1 Tax=Potamilus streckersoni TaxID=2493646 RepID=A0AAE0SIL8_9BIVA|nr:hypothetical protein CHS0354_001754 [Potamilus streckersoni]